MKESTLIDTLWSVAESIWLTKQAQALGTAGLSPRRCLISHRAAWREALLSPLDTRCPNKKKKNPFPVQVARARSAWPRANPHDRILHTVSYLLHKINRGAAVTAWHFN